jgi:hypothetical protein
MALALALSVTATTGAGIVLTARIICGMAGAVEFPGLLRPGTRRWVVAQSLAAASAAEIWSLGGVAAVGFCLMLASRFALRSPYLRVRRETGAARG